MQLNVKPPFFSADRRSGEQNGIFLTHRSHQQQVRTGESGTYLVAQEVSLDLGGGGVGAETPHHGDQLCGCDLPIPLAVVQRETLLKVWKVPQTHRHK